MKIIFFGSDDFAAVHLESLLNSGHKVICCVTTPDMPQGRGMKISISPIRQIALEKSIDCLQPISLKDKVIVEKLKAYDADLFIVVAYGRLLTQEMLDIPKKICINVHGSLLPKYRGAAPINWAILNGDKETGVTLQRMVLALDAGEIIAQETIRIGDDENAAQLRHRLSLLGAKLLVNVLDKNPLGQFLFTPQDETLVTFAPKLTKEMGIIDWGKTAQDIMNQVRGLLPWPGAYAFYHGKMLKITKVQFSLEDKAKFVPGQVIKVSKNGFNIACFDKALLVTEVQPQAGKIMTAHSFVAGHKIAQGDRLGVSPT